MDKVKEKGLSTYDAILMDFVMPVMDGPDATKAIRELDYGGPIIGCTGNTLHRDLQRFHDSGCDRVIGKPFGVEVFHQYMDELALMPSRQLGAHPINTSLQHILSTHPFNMPYQPALLIYHNTLTLTTCIISVPYPTFPMKTTHPVNILYY